MTREEGYDQRYEEGFENGHQEGYAKVTKKDTGRDVKTGMRRVLKRGDIVKFLKHGFLQLGGASHAE